MAGMGWVFFEPRGKAVIKVFLVLVVLENIALKYILINCFWGLSFGHQMPSQLSLLTTQNCISIRLSRIFRVSMMFLIGISIDATTK